MRRRPSSLVRDRRGVVAVEFALLAPFMMLLLFGLFEVVSLVRVTLKLSHSANELAKLVAQTPIASSATAPVVTGGTSGTLGDSCKGAGYELAPYASSGLSAQIVSVTNTGGTVAKGWESDNSCPGSASAYASTAVSQVTSYGLTPNTTDSTIVVHMNYTYTPLLHYVLGSTWTLSQTAFARPRSAVAVTCSSGCS